jgi:ELWxxDGT repeat protein
MALPSLLLDATSGSGGSFPSLDVSPSAVAGPGGFWFFVVNASSRDHEIWWSDGSSAGTRRLLAVRGTIARGDAVRFGDRLLVCATTTDLGAEPLLIDSAGALSPLDLNPGGTTDLNGVFEPNSSSPYGFRVIGERVRFSASASLERGQELWSSDGSASGSRELREIAPGTYDSEPGEFTAFGSRVLFAATQRSFLDPLTGRELWSSDGSKNGTRLVADIRPGEIGSDPGELTAFAGAVVFRADDGTTGNELWRSDGTAAGTRLLKDTAPGSASGNPADFTVVGQRLFFSVGGSDVNPELWVSDGSADGTSLVKRINPYEYGGGLRFLSDLTALGDRLYFFADDGSGAGKELWSSDGSAAGTAMVRDINPALNGSGVSRGLVAAGGRLWFAADNGRNGMELWCSDGTAAGTYQVHDIRPGAMGSLQPHGNLFSLAGQRLLFRADDGSSGLELWSQDVMAPPPAPVVAELLSVVDDVGPECILVSDGAINDPTPLLRGRISGPLQSGQSVAVHDGSSVLGTASVGADGRSWTFQPTLTGSSGTTYSFEARVQGPGADPDAFSNRIRITLDTVAPSPRISSVGGSDKVVTGSVIDRQVQGTGEAGGRVDILQGTTLLGSTQVDPGGRWSYKLTLNNLRSLGGQGKNRSVSARQEDAAGNSGQSSSFTFTINTNTNTSTVVKNDLITLATPSEPYVVPRLSDSLLSSFDVLSNYAAGKRIDAPASVAATNLAASVGTASSLTAQAITALLSAALFPANRAVAFQVASVQGTFVALNDRNAGFAPASDAVLHLPRHSFAGQGPIAIF